MDRGSEAGRKEIGVREEGEGERGADEPYSVCSVYDRYFSDVVLTSIRM